MNDFLALRQAAIQHRLHGSINRVRWQAGDIDRLLAKFSVEANASEIQRLLAPADQQAPVVVAPSASDTPVAAGNRSYTFTISTATLDSFGDTIAPDGWKLDVYQTNSVVLWGHDAAQIPIGRATRTWVAGKKLKSTVELAPASANPAAEQVRALIEGGFLRATSVGFMPLKWSFSQDKSRPFGVDFSEQRLLEWSIVNVPANGDCLIDSGQASTKALDPAHGARLRDIELLSVSQ